MSDNDSLASIVNHLPDYSIQNDENNYSSLELNVKDEQNDHNPNDTQIKSNLIEKEEKNVKKFFLLTTGYKPGLFKGTHDTQIGKIIEKYIQDIGEKEEIKNNFYCHGKKIDNLETTIQDLGIFAWDFIVSK